MSRKKIEAILGELRSWLPNYDHKENDYPTLLFRVLASLPGGDRLEDMGYETFNLGWHEADQLGRVLEAIEDQSDVEQLVAGLVDDEEEEEDLGEMGREHPYYTMGEASRSGYPGGLARARAELAAVGFSIQHRPDWGEYRVFRRGDRNPDHGYFTSDLDDAVRTGLSMAQRGEYAAPMDEARGPMMEGRTSMIAYRLHLESRGHAYTPVEWRVRARYSSPGYGAPTDANLERYVHHFEQSTQSGGPNAHLGATHISRAWIVDQRTNQTVASYEADVVHRSLHALPRRPPLMLPPRRS